MMKHTPGPWNARIIGQRGHMEIFAGNDALIAALHLRDNTTGNAHLIAAAPDLLVTLSRLIDAAVSVYDGQSEDFPGLVEATEAACRVYEKATGG